MELILLSVSSFLFVFTFIAAVAMRARRSRTCVEERLKQFRSESGDERIIKRVREGRKKNPIRISSALVDQLTGAGVPIRPEEYMLVWIGLALVPSTLAAVLGARMFACMVLAMTGLALPPAYVKLMKVKRIRAFEAQLGDALMSISNCLKSGLTFQQGMMNVSEQMPEPISKEFARTLREIQLGNTMEGALNNLARRIPSPDLKLMITAVLITRQVGGSLSEVMDSIARTIIDRLRVKAEIHTLTSQGRMSGIIIGCLPIAIGIILSLINPSYMSFFVTEELGRTLLMVAAGMETVGFIVIKKMVTVKY